MNGCGGNIDYDHLLQRKLALLIEELDKKKNDTISVLIIHRKNSSLYDLIKCLFEKNIPTCVVRNDFETKDLDNLIPIFDLVISSAPTKLEKISDYEDFYLYKGGESIEDIPSGAWYFLTSGSTGNKKMVVVDRNTMNFRIKQDQELLGLDENSKFLNYLNLDHELGIYSYLTSIQFAGEVLKSNIISEVNFLNVLVKNKITHLVSTSFIWE